MAQPQAFPQVSPPPYLGDQLHGADVGVGPEQDVLQLRLLLVDVLYGEPLHGAIALGEPAVLVRGLLGGETAAVRGGGPGG